MRALILATTLYATVSGAAFAGTVSDVISWPSIPVHAGLAPDGRVMTFGATPQGGQGGYDYILWDPSKGTGSSALLELPNSVNFNSFCVGGILEPATGKIFLAGGAGDLSTSASAVHSVSYDYSTSKLSSSYDMHYPRYYASLTTLPDGRLLVNGGSPPYGNQSNATAPAEMFTPGQGWTVLTDTAGSPQKQGDVFTTGNPFWYPHQYPIGNNELFVIAGKYTYRLGYGNQGSYRDVQNVTQSNWGASSTAVMYRPGLVMQIGGGTPGNNLVSTAGSNVASIYDLRAAISNPSQAITRRDTTMRLGRHFTNATVLANGEVLVSGGAEGDNTLVNVANRLEIYSPDTDRWRFDAATQRPRLYHSIALLLKDGRVLTGGGGAPGPISGSDVEIFTPDYLLDKDGQPATRPSIVDGPKSALSLGQTFRITANKPIKRVTIVKTGVVTHSYNTDQRFFEAGFTASGNYADVVFPNDAVNATPGIYMVFVFDADGVASVGKFVRLKSPTNDSGYSLPNDMPTSTTPTGTGRPTSGWVFCAHEGENCPVEGSQQVRYGANGSYKTVTVSTQTTCNSANFGGDPAPGTVKICQIQANSFGNLTTANSAQSTSTPTTTTNNSTSSSTTSTSSPTTSSSSSRSSNSSTTTSSSASITSSSSTSSTKSSSSSKVQIGESAIKIAAAADGTIVVVSKNTTVWKYSASTGWTSLQGQMKDVAVANAGHIYGVGMDGTVYQYNGKTPVRIGYGATAIAATTDGTVAVVNSSNQVWIKTGADFVESWRMLPKSRDAVKIAIMNANSFWIYATDNIVYRVTAAGVWTAVGVNVDDMTASSDGTVTVVAKGTSDMWRKTGDDNTQNWRRLSGAVAKVATPDAKTLIEIGSDSNIYRETAAFLN